VAGTSRARRALDALRGMRAAPRVALGALRGQTGGEMPMDAALLKGRVALVTGAGRNIGRAIALALADAGAQVAVNVRASRHEGQAVVDDIVARGSDALLVLADVTQRAQVDAMIAAIAQRFGRLDIVVNNAAIRLEAPFDELRYADWQAAHAVCVDGAFHCTQSAICAAAMPAA